MFSELERKGDRLWQTPACVDQYFKGPAATKPTLGRGFYFFSIVCILETTLLATCGNWTTCGRLLTLLPRSPISKRDVVRAVRSAGFCPRVAQLRIRVAQLCPNFKDYLKAEQLRTVIVAFLGLQ